MSATALGRNDGADPGDRGAERDQNGPPIRSREVGASVLDGSRVGGEGAELSVITKEAIAGKRPGAGLNWARFAQVGGVEAIGVYFRHQTSVAENGLPRIPQERRSVRGWYRHRGVNG